MTNELLRATPFHARAAEANGLNAWENRGGFTLASSYGDAHSEALAARFGAVLGDVSWRPRTAIAGARAEEFVSRLFTRNASRLSSGAALQALWLNDAGGVRGAGVVVRMGRDSFLLASPWEDLTWITQAAALYDVTVRDVTADDGVLALVGPASAQVLRAAGLDPKLEPLSLRKSFWRGLDVTLSRLGDGYELWCKPDDALIVWDRIVAAGRSFALCPAGQKALDIFDLEGGTPCAGRDYAPAREGFASEPSPQSLGLSGLVDREHTFNGRAGYLADRPEMVLAGILLDSETPAPNGELTRASRPVGRSLGSLYSPALRRAIALAVLAADAAAPGTELMLDGGACRTAALPFLPVPAPILPSDGDSAQ